MFSLSQKVKTQYRHNKLMLELFEVAFNVNIFCWEKGN